MQEQLSKVVSACIKVVSIRVENRRGEEIMTKMAAVGFFVRLFAEHHQLPTCRLGPREAVYARLTAALFVESSIGRSNSL